MRKELVYKNRKARERADKYLKERLNVSRERIKELLQCGEILLNGKKVCPSRILQPEDRITFNEERVFAANKITLEPEKRLLEEIYSDSDIIVVNKPPGVLTHPTKRVMTGTLVNFLLDRININQQETPLRPGVVHRLDKETSGVIVFARTRSALDNLERQFRNREVEKEYFAVVKGVFEPGETQVEFTVVPDKNDRTKMVVNYLRGKQAITKIAVEKYLDGLTLLKVMPVTGRTHQIRLALAHLGYPIIGDLRYGVKSDLINRVALHARKLVLNLPSTGERKTFFADMPEDLRKITGDC